jgi:hypothetical protein
VASIFDIESRDYIVRDFPMIARIGFAEAIADRFGKRIFQTEALIRNDQNATVWGMAEISNKIVISIIAFKGGERKREREGASLYEPAFIRAAESVCPLRAREYFPH